MVYQKIKQTGKIVDTKARKFQSDVRKKIATAIIAAFGFVIALVWRDAIQAGIDRVLDKLGIEGTGYFFKILGAIIVTIICVFGLIIIARWSEKEENPEKKPEKK